MIAQGVARGPGHCCLAIGILPSNGDAHLKNLLMYHQVIVLVTEGRLDRGPWQPVYHAEFDGQRKKRAMIKVMGE